MDGRHYIDYVNSASLINQEKLCKRLKDIGKFGTIENRWANPMSIRLLITREGNLGIQKFQDDIYARLQSVNNIVYTFNPSGRAIVYDHIAAASGSAGMAFGFDESPINAGVVDPKTLQDFTYHSSQNAYIDETNPKYLFKLEYNIYGFFMNYMSALDRIAYEINQLYHISGSYWTDFHLDSKNSWKTVRDQSFASLLSHLKSSRAHEIDKPRKYRNRLAHEGILPIQIDKSSGSILIQSNPEDTNSPYDLNLASFSDNCFSELISFINDLYGIFIDDQT